tara:strand:+ start:8241 stop:8414 length:174 start_codon:yes stop_codon:yes gene_type:complete
MRADLRACNGLPGAGWIANQAGGFAGGLQADLRADLQAYKLVRIRTVFLLLDCEMDK